MVPCDGMGTLVQHVDGGWCVAMWPSTAITSRGASLASCYHFLNGMTAATFKLWADEHLQYCQLMSGSAVWVPYGWHYCALATYAKGLVDGLRGPSALLMQPYLSAGLANETWPVAEDAARSLDLYLQSILLRCSQEEDYAERMVDMRP